MNYSPVVIREKLACDDRWLVRGLIAIYRKQTNDEQAKGITLHENQVGFNGVDAPVLTDLAQWAIRRPLTPKQIALVRRKMLKYSGQLAAIANKEI